MRWLVELSSRREQCVMRISNAFALARAVALDLSALIWGLGRAGYGWLLPLVLALLIVAGIWLLVSPKGIAPFIYPIL